MHPSLYSPCASTHPWYHSPAAHTLFPMYPSQDQDYPSPAPSDPSHSSQQPDQHQNQSSFGQIDSSIGPSRVSRRQASLKCLPVRRVSLSLNYARPDDASAQSQDATGPHPDSPSTANGHATSPHMPSVQSPYHPNTPSSMASPYSPFEHVRRSRTRSTSHFEVRSQSPALSTTSGVTNSSYTFDSSTSVEQSNISASRAIVREKHKKHRLRDVDRKNICIYHLTNPNARQEDIGAYFGVERSTISKILKEKDRWLSISEEDECDQSTKHRPSKFPEIEGAMINSLQEWSDRGEAITDQLIRERALSIAKTFQITSDKFKGSSGWVENFKHRHDIRRGEWHQANKMLPPDYAIHHSHSSTVPPTPVLIEYDRRIHTQGSESQSSNKPSGSHEDQDQDQQHAHGRLLATPAHLPEAMRNDVPYPTHLTSSSTMVDPVLQAQGGSLKSDHPLPGHSLQDIQHSPEIQHHQPLYHHNQHHDSHQKKHHNYQQHHHQHHNQQQHQAVVYNAYGQTLCGPGVSAPPTIAEAEQAINLLITFIDTDGRGIIKEDERQKLADIKSALFQAAANGIRYERSAD